MANGVILIVPIALTEVSVFGIGQVPPIILNGGSKFNGSFTDWNEAMNWIKNNTPEDSVVASWWDYGYWIQTKGERTSLADNSTLIDHVIEKIAKIFLSTPDQGWHSLQEMEADYFVIFLASERLGVTGNENQPLYILNGAGGDESKKQWFMRIAQEPLPKYLHDDGLSGTDYFWNETLMGQMIPFKLLGYVNLETNQQSLNYQPGFLAIYEKNIKLSEDGNGPLKLVYSSPSFERSDPGHMVGVYIYEIN